MDCPHVGGIRLVDWCTRRPTGRALKTRSCSGLHPWKVHAWEVYDWWTGAFVDQLIEPFKKESFQIEFFSFLFSTNKKIVASIRIGREIWCLPNAGFHPPLLVPGDWRRCHSGRRRESQCTKSIQIEALRCRKEVIIWFIFKHSFCREAISSLLKALFSSQNLTFKFILSLHINEGRKYHINILNI